MQNKKGQITRRSLLKGAGILGAASVVAASTPALFGCSSQQGDDRQQPLSVSDNDIISIMDSFAETDQNPPHMVNTANYNLPAGTVLLPAEGSWCAALIQGEAANPLIKAGIFSLASGNLASLVNKPISAGTSVVIQDARASDEVYGWLEVDTSTNAWTLYGATLSNGTLASEPTKLFSADAQWEAPSFVASGTAIIFQTLPITDGTQAKEYSRAYLWRPGMAEPKVVLESAGRFACAPGVSEGQVIFVPRADHSQETHYALSAYALSDDCATNTIALVLPSPIKPSGATMVAGRLAYTIEAAYSSSGVLGKLGTFMQAEPGNQNTTQSFYYIDREPYTAPAGTSNILVSKNRASYLVCVLSEKTFGNLYAINRAADYGEYPLRLGSANDFATYASVKDPVTGRPVQVTVRVFSYQ